MATINSDTFQSSADLNLWFKIRSGDALNLADVPEIIPLRWTYFRDTWVDLRATLSNLAASNSNPDYFRAVLDELDTFIRQQRGSTTARNPFSDSNVYFRFYPIFDAMLIEQISLTVEEYTLIGNSRSRVELFSKNDFLRIKKDIVECRNQLADMVGLGDEDYNRIYNRATVTSTLTPTISDINLMGVLQNQISAVDFILANLFTVDAAIDPFALARANANNPDIDIGQYSSGSLVRLNYGEDLQALAYRHLGDADKWIDIAIANGLREPYIDEVGEQLFTISNGRSNQINFSSTTTDGSANINKFYVNQFLFIQSNTIRFPSQRLITAIKEVPMSGEIILTLNGDADLDSYTLEDQASIRIFKPNTVNSSQFVLIPSSAPLGDARQDELPWFLAGAAADEKNMKIDIAIEESGALLFTPNGDLSLSYGLANAVQATKLKLMTERGSNRYHPSYGIVNVVGKTNTQDSDVRKMLIDSIVAQIAADSRFERIESLNVDRRVDEPSAGVTFLVEFSVRLTGSKTVIPISFSVTI